MLRRRAHQSDSGVASQHSASSARGPVRGAIEQPSGPLALRTVNVGPGESVGLGVCVGVDVSDGGSVCVGVDVADGGGVCVGVAVGQRISTTPLVVRTAISPPMSSTSLAEEITSATVPAATPSRI